MSTITKTRIRNFQSLRDVTILFNRYTNVLVGESDVGKTAVVRALRMALENKVPSDDFISFGAKYASVEIWFDSGDKITRKKGPSGKANSYELIKGKEKSQKFESFGKEIPRQIQEVIGFMPLDIGGAKKYSINFHKQTDPPFLLGEQDSIKAKFIGQLSDLLLLDQAIVDINSEIRTANSSIKFSTNERSRLKRSLDKYKPLPKFEEFLEELKVQLSKVSRLDTKGQNLKNLSKKRSNLIERRDYLANEIVRLSICDKIEINSLEEKRDYIVSLQSLYKRIKKTVSRRKNFEEQVETQSMLIEQLTDVEQKILKEQKLLDGLSAVDYLLKSNNERREGNERVIKESDRIIVKHSQEMDDLMDELPERCHWCGTIYGTEQKKFIAQGSLQ